jgi:hypothetical protein
MALTVISKPQLRTPAYNDQWFICSSTQIGVVDFYYSVTITVNGGTSQVRKILQRPDGFLKFNAKEIAKNYIQHYFNPTDIGIVEAVNKSVTVVVSIAEFYSGTLQTATSNTYYAFDACLKDKDFLAYNYVNYTTDILLGNTFLNKPDQTYSITSDIIMSLYKNTFTTIVVNLYSVQGGTLINTQTLSFPAGSSSNKIYNLNIGFNFWNSLGFTLVDNNYIVTTITDGVSTYPYENFKVTNICTKYNEYQLYYMDRSGRIQFLNTALLSSDTVSKVTNEVRLNKETLSNSGVLIRNSWDREVLEISNATTYKKTLNTNWITETQSYLLDELFDSPFVWLHNVDALGVNYVPCKITDRGYNYQKTSNVPLFNLLITIEFSQHETRQRGA